MKRLIVLLFVAASFGSSPLPASQPAPLVAAPAGTLRGAAVGDIRVSRGIRTPFRRRVRCAGNPRCRRRGLPAHRARRRQGVRNSLKTWMSPTAAPRSLPAGAATTGADSVAGSGDEPSDAATTRTLMRSLHLLTHPRGPDGNARASLHMNAEGSDR